MPGRSGRSGAVRWLRGPTVSSQTFETKPSSFRSRGGWPSQSRPLIPTKESFRGKRCLEISCGNPRMRVSNGKPRTKIRDVRSALCQTNRSMETHQGGTSKPEAIANCEVAISSPTCFRLPGLSAVVPKRGKLQGVARKHIGGMNVYRLLA